MRHYLAPSAITRSSLRAARDGIRFRWRTTQLKFTGATAFATPSAQVKSLRGIAGDGQPPLPLV